MAEPALPARRAVSVRLRGGTVGGEISYLRTGSGSPLVLIHGVGMNATIWQPQIAALAARFDVIAMDMPGHGGSLLPPAGATLDDYSDAVIGLLDGLGILQAALVGHSMGALVATHTALCHPSRVLRLVAMNAVFRRPPELRRAVQARAAELEERGFAASIAPTLARWFGRCAAGGGCGRLSPHLSAVRNLRRGARAHAPDAERAGAVHHRRA